MKPPPPSSGQTSPASERNNPAAQRQQAILKHYRTSAQIDQLPVALTELAMMPDGSLRSRGLNIEPEFAEPMALALREMADRLIRYAARPRTGKPPAEIIDFPPNRP